MDKTEKTIKDGIDVLIKTYGELSENVNKLKQEKQDLVNENTIVMSELSQKKVELESLVKSLDNEIIIKREQSNDLSTQIAEKTKIIEGLARSAELITVERNKIIEPVEGLKNNVLDIMANIGPMFTEVTTVISEATKMAETSKQKTTEVLEIIDTKVSEITQRDEVCRIRENKIGEREKQVDVIINRLKTA